MTRRNFRLAAAVLALASACSDAAQRELTPRVPSLAAGRVAATHRTVERTTPLPRALSRSATIDASGGVIELPAAGLRIVIPANALPDGTDSVTITATAIAGDQFAYELEPSGLVFAKPIRIEQDLRGALIHALAEGRTPIVSYFKSADDLDPATRRATTYEDLVTSVDPTARRLTADVWHFSGYIVCWD